jgi:dihydrofolate reductase
VIPADCWEDRVRELKHADGDDLLAMGSAQLVRGLRGSGLVDELHLSIEPVLLGGGQTISPQEGQLRRLRLAETTTSGASVLVTRNVSDSAVPDNTVAEKNRG